MATTALHNEAILRRMATTDSTPVSSANISPLDSPRSSPSSTSLSSLASNDAVVQKPVAEKKQLVDTYGNSFEIPDYTISDIHNAIPKHCFERSAATGLYYVARDVVSLATTFYLFNRFVTPENIPSTPLRAGLWFLYTVVQGLFGTGLWVLAHECGHQSFSPSKVLNDTVGWFCHSALLVPYFSWKISHGKHHKATGHLERDMVFVPSTREEWATRRGYLLHQLDELTEETPIATAWHLISQQIGGWPMYLFTNVTGHNKHERQREGRGVGKQNGFGGGVNHFNPNSPLYEAKDAKLIVLSDLGLLITSAILFWVGRTYGFANLFVWYLAPYLWVNHWLVAITFLQHTDPSLPHYAPDSWTYTRGAAATIDREFGFVGRQLLHGIIETHVLHHYVSTIPFYHADEASDAIREVMGRHYRSDTKDGSIGFLKSLWKSMRWCEWVEPLDGATGEDAGVMFFRNRNGLGVPPAKIEKPTSS
jgi:omega-6 fatty acid desaturase (delta-12 desaturase)